MHYLSLSSNCHQRWSAGCWVPLLNLVVCCQVPTIHLASRDSQWWWCGCCSCCFCCPLLHCQFTVPSYLLSLSIVQTLFVKRKWNKKENENLPMAQDHDIVCLLGLLFTGLPPLHLVAIGLSVIIWVVSYQPYWALHEQRLMAVVDCHCHQHKINQWKYLASHVIY